MSNEVQQSLMKSLDSVRRGVRGNYQLLSAISFIVQDALSRSNSIENDLTKLQDQLTLVSLSPQSQAEIRYYSERASQGESPDTESSSMAHHWAAPVIQSTPADESTYSLHPILKNTETGPADSNSSCVHPMILQEGSNSFRSRTTVLASEGARATCNTCGALLRLVWTPVPGVQDTESSQTSQSLASQLSVSVGEMWEKRFESIRSMMREFDLRLREVERRGPSSPATPQPSPSRRYTVHDVNDRSDA